MIEIVFGTKASHDVVAAERELLALRRIVPTLGVAGIRCAGGVLTGFICEVGEPSPCDAILCALSGCERPVKGLYLGRAASAAIVGYPRGS